MRGDRSVFGGNRGSVLAVQAGALVELVMTSSAACEMDVPQFVDARGRLAALEELRPLPFRPVRTFVISDVPPGAHRAGHIIRCSEFLWMAAGACRATVRPGDSGGEEQQFHLTVRGRGLYLPPGSWIDLFDFQAGSVLVCLADRRYAAGG